VLSATFRSIIANVQYCLLHHTYATLYRSIPARIARPTTQSVARRVLRRGGVLWARFPRDNIVRLHRIDTRAGFPDSCFHGSPFTTPRPISARRRYRTRHDCWELAKSRRASYSYKCRHVLQMVVSLVERKVLNGSLMFHRIDKRVSFPDSAFHGRPSTNLYLPAWRGLLLLDSRHFARPSTTSHPRLDASALPYATKNAPLRSAVNAQPLALVESQ
jgi:hypothetical protein